MAYVEQISVFDILKIGIGPSSSHTLGTWRATQRFISDLETNFVLSRVEAIQITLYGSLAKTGKGHGTDKAILLSLNGEEPETVDTKNIEELTGNITSRGYILLKGKSLVAFNPNTDIIFRKHEVLDFHPNGIKFVAFLKDGSLFEEIYYSIGGGFVVKEGEPLIDKNHVEMPFPGSQARDLQEYSRISGKTIAEIVWENEKVWREPSEIRKGLLDIWEVMKNCAFNGCHGSEDLPGGLHTNRRAPRMYRHLMGDKDFRNADLWLDSMVRAPNNFEGTLKWVSCFALAVNEENAAFGRIVTAPTNGAAGVIPAVLLYYLCFCRREIDEEKIIQFLLICGDIGSYYKKGATLSAAMGGCQAEIGVSSSMAAAALTECLGGTVEQALMAAEIAMEHHLGLTCDPVGGLVQVPCIERNSMGAVKAITACYLALESNANTAKVTLDNVIKTMWETSKDMNVKYKETSEGGLAVNIPVNIPEC